MDVICTVTLTYFVYFGKYLRSLEMTNTWWDKLRNYITSSHTVVIETEPTDKEKRDSNFNARVVRHINRKSRPD